VAAGRGGHHVPMHRRPRLVSLAAVAVAAGLALGGAVGPGPVGAQAPDPGDPTVTTAPIAPPRASIVVDVDSGRVVLASGAREAVPPASTTKILTALLAVQRLGLDTDVTVPPEAVFATPRRLQLEPGSVWEVEDLLYAALHCSCNDAAWTLGQVAGGGTMAGFEVAAAELAAQLGLADQPVLRDPAGLDGPASISGGNLISARDLAIAGRAFMADPELAAIAADEGHEWVGGDGRPHAVTNLNQFLGRYEGAFGLKTGSTSRAGLTFVAAAEQGDRRLLAVVLGSQNHYADARALLDRGFLLAAAGEVTDDVLPPVPDALGGQPTTTTTTGTTTEAGPATAPATGPGDGGDTDGGGVLRSRPPTDRPGADTSGDAARRVVWFAVGLVAALVVLALAVAARRRLRPPGIDRRPARPRRRPRRARAAVPDEA